MNRFAEAITVYKKSIELDAHNPPAFYNLGNAYYMLGQYDNSINSYQMALRRKPDSAQCYFNLATAYNDKGDKKQAAHYFRTSLRHDDSNPEAYYELGLIFIISDNADEREGARKALHKCLELNPEHEKAQAALANIQSSHD